MFTSFDYSISTGFLSQSPGGGWEGAGVAVSEVGTAVEEISRVLKTPAVSYAAHCSASRHLYMLSRMLKKM